MFIGNATLLGLLIVIGIYGVMLGITGLVACKHAVAKAWANIDVLLKQRHDEPPKLAWRRKASNINSSSRKPCSASFEARGIRHAEAEEGRALGKAEGLLRSGLGRLFAIAEAIRS